MKSNCWVVVRVGSLTAAVEVALDDLNPASREALRGAKLEAALADVSPGEVLQFERLGYFAADPELPGLFHRTVGLRDEWAAVQKRG